MCFAGIKIEPIKKNRKKPKTGEKRGEKKYKKRKARLCLWLEHSFPEHFQLQEQTSFNSMHLKIRLMLIAKIMQIPVSEQYTPFIDL